MSAALERDRAVALLRRLVSIPSLSGSEEEASRFLVEQMSCLGYERSYVDAVGNAVGELGPEDCDRVVVLLGHIDTVAGEVPVRIDSANGSPRLYGRGSVDAKGPLATFTVAAARLGAQWGHSMNLRLVVVGAVEEEAATSRGARFVRDRFDGQEEPKPRACVIGEPSHWHRVTLGYKGRLLVDLEARRDVTHTAGPDPGVATLAVELWNEITAWAARYNEDRSRPFEQLLPSLRRVDTESDGLTEGVSVRAGLRLPPEFDPEPLRSTLEAWAGAKMGQRGNTDFDLQRQGELPGEARFSARGPQGSLALRFWGYEPAWRGESRTGLVRSFLEAIRHHGDESTRPRFVVKTGTSDLNVVGPAWGCPILAYGPGDSRLDHTPQEHLELDEYWRAVRVLERALANLAETLD